MLKILNASKSFAKTKVLDDVSFTLAKGSVVGLAGASGSGKSTLLRCIQGLEELDAGSIVCSGKTGFMFQDFQLFPHMTVLENLCYAPQHVLADNKCEVKAKSLLQELGLQAKLNAVPEQLSGGQKQRVAFARSLMMQPALLLCDEPTSGLDFATIEDVVSLLEEAKKKGISMLIASHDLDLLTSLTDRVLVMQQGSLVKDLDLSSVSNPVATLREYY